MAVAVNSTVQIGGVTTPGGLDGTGVTDVSAALQAFLATVPDGATIDFGNGTYRFEAGLAISNRHNLTFVNGNFIQNYLDPAGTIPPSSAGSVTGNVYRSRCGFTMSANTSGITFDNIHYRGPNPVDGVIDAYDARFEAQHAWVTQGCSDIYWKNTSAHHYYGDSISFQAGPIGPDGITFQLGHDMLVEDHLMYKSGRMGISIVHCTDLIFRRVTAYDMRRSTFDFEPNGNNGIASNVEIDSLSYGTHYSGFNIFAAHAQVPVYDHYYIHDCFNNNLGSMYLPATLDILIEGGYPTLVYGGTSNVPRRHNDFHFARNTCTVVPLKQELWSFTFVDNLVLEDNHLIAQANGDSWLAGTNMCGPITTSGNVVTNSIDPLLKVNWTNATVNDGYSPGNVVAALVGIGAVDVLTNLRNPRRQPFAVTSIWNTAIGSGATIAAGSLPTGQSTALDPVFFVEASSADPVVNQYPAQAGGNGYCGATVVPTWSGFDDPYAGHAPCRYTEQTNLNFTNANYGPGSVHDGVTAVLGDRFLITLLHQDSVRSVGVFNVVGFNTSFIAADYQITGGYRVGQAIRVLEGNTGSGQWIVASTTANPWVPGPDLATRSSLTVTHYAPTFVGGVAGTLNFPDATLLPDKDAITGTAPFNMLTVLDPDGHTLEQFSHAARCMSGGPLYGNAVSDGDITGNGIAGPRGSGLSGLGGALTIEDVRDTHPINHALAISLSSALLSFNTSGFTWPASTAPAGASSAYTGSNTKVKLGTLLTIPTSVTEPDLLLSSALGSKLFYALQNYGAYIVDDKAFAGYRLAARLDAVEWVSDNLGDISTTGTVNADINALIAACVVVTNNTLSTIGGGGTPAQPAADPLG